MIRLKYLLSAGSPKIEELAVAVFNLRDSGTCSNVVRAVVIIANSSEDLDSKRLTMLLRSIESFNSLQLETRSKLAGMFARLVQTNKLTPRQLSSCFQSLAQMGMESPGVVELVEARVRKSLPDFNGWENEEIARIHKALAPFHSNDSELLDTLARHPGCSCLYHQKGRCTKADCLWIHTTKLRRNKSAGDKAISEIACFHCFKNGHLARDCTNQSSRGGYVNDCYRCGKSGHLVRNCPLGDPRASSRSNQSPPPSPLPTLTTVGARIKEELVEQAALNAGVDRGWKMVGAKKGGGSPRGWEVTVNKPDEAERGDAENAMDEIVAAPEEWEKPPTDVEEVSNQLDMLRSDIRLEALGEWETLLAAIRCEMQDGQVEASKQLDTQLLNFKLEVQDELNRQVVVVAEAMDIQLAKFKYEMQDELKKQVAVVAEAMVARYEVRAEAERQLYDERANKERLQGKWEHERLKDEIKQLASRLDAMMFAASQKKDAAPPYVLPLKTELEQLLETLGLEYLEPVLSENEVELDVLSMMSEEDFRQLGISQAASRLLWEATRSADGLQDNASFVTAQGLNPTRLHLSGLAPSCSRADLEDYFGRFGRITDAFCIRGKNNSTNPGVGFVTFTTAQETAAVLRAGPHTIGGREAEVDYAKLRSQDKISTQAPPLPLTVID